MKAFLILFIFPIMILASEKTLIVYNYESFEEVEEERSENEFKRTRNYQQDLDLAVKTTVDSKLSLNCNVSEDAYPFVSISLRDESKCSSLCWSCLKDLKKFFQGVFKSICKKKS